MSITPIVNHKCISHVQTLRSVICFVIFLFLKKDSTNSVVVLFSTGFLSVPREVVEMVVDGLGHDLLVEGLSTVPTPDRGETSVLELATAVATESN